MLISVKNEYDYCDIIDCPNHIVTKLLYLQEEYDHWAVTYDKIVDLDAFVEWLNEYRLKDSPEKVKIVYRGIFPTEEQKKYPFIQY